jgi:hypothetical protein
MFFITIISSLIVFWFLKDKLHLTLKKSIIRLGVIGLLLLIICITNIFYNWGYFKQYSGDKTTEYYLAYCIWYATGYGLLASTTILISSIISNINQK